MRAWSRIYFTYGIGRGANTSKSGATRFVAPYASRTFETAAEGMVRIVSSQERCGRTSRNIENGKECENFVRVHGTKSPRMLNTVNQMRCG